MDADLRRLTKALLFAAEAHRNQRRKGAAQEPYLNHLIEVLDLVVQATDGTDMDMVLAALLHDVVEDTSTTYEDIVANFGEHVAQIVHENSDDMSLPKDERRRARIAAMPLKSREAKIVKMADVISNLRAIAVSPLLDGPPNGNSDISTLAGNWSTPRVVQNPESNGCLMKRQQRSRAPSAKNHPSLSRDAKSRRVTWKMPSANPSILSTCRIPKTELWEKATSIAFANS